MLNLIIITFCVLKNTVKQEIVFKKDKATLHVISKRCEETVIIPIKLEGNPLTLINSKVCR